ncbi:TPA: DUF488 family protein [Enterococcus faecium]|nr:DUF488 family protein [Enterococcus faecium]
MIKLKRVYLDAEKEDGYRILVDRFWPRGISKEKAQLDLWLKEIAPSNEARKTFDHVPERFASFAKKYQQELIFEEEKKQAIFNRIRQKSPILYRWVMNAVRYEGYRW